MKRFSHIAMWGIDFYDGHGDISWLTSKKNGRGRNLTF